ncbi:PQQ-dependent sugar dehydrogenase [Brevibacterium sp. S111]|uniref:PQQ-dependent sugar dehydrogenase n=1 Tax=unclassified Brevibacterium TaxID=2614124 RepID=UPI0014369E94|nr:PQQ-dependent sugar dehydrogenase [Brevibacterium sp. S111]
MAAVIAALALLLSGCTHQPPSPEGSESPASADDTADPTAAQSDGAADTGSEDGAPQLVAEDLNTPWSIAFFKGTPLVSERDSGRILELSEDRPAQSREVATVESVVAEGEGGLLGLAVADESLFAYFTSAEDNRIQRFPLSGEPGRLELGEPETILDGIAKASFHNGGRLAIGPDGKLYATAGDAGNPADAQDPESLNGSILRLNFDGTVPADNPDPDSPVYTYGHRNAQGLGWDAEGTMYASEFGQDTWDELNIIEAGRNYGWPEVEGIPASSGSTGSGSAGDFVAPVHQWSTEEASPSGIAVTEDSIAIANLRGQRLRWVPLADTARQETQFVGEYGRLRDVVSAPGGELWLMTNNTDGRGDPSDGDDRILSVRSR